MCAFRLHVMDARCVLSTRIKWCGLQHPMILGQCVGYSSYLKGKVVASFVDTFR